MSIFLHCKNCKFCDKRIGSEDYGERDNKFLDGTCKKNPPVPVMNSDDDIYWLQPHVDKHDGCHSGEYEHE